MWLQPLSASLILPRCACSHGVHVRAPGAYAVGCRKVRSSLSKRSRSINPKPQPEQVASGERAQQDPFSACPSPDQHRLFEGLIRPKCASCRARCGGPGPQQGCENLREAGTSGSILWFRLKAASEAPPSCASETPTGGGPGKLSKPELKPPRDSESATRTRRGGRAGGLNLAGTGSGRQLEGPGPSLHST